MKEINKNDILNAYRKLKSYIYYDNFFIFLRESLATFESDSNFESRLDNLLLFINNQDEIDSEYFDNLLNKIDYTIIPKSFKNDDLGEEFIISNRFTKSAYTILQNNYLINAPIEIHIISILWVLFEGKNLVKNYSKSNYAYALEFDHSGDNIVHGLRLFKPYFEQYQKWRDKGIDVAQHFVKDETDVLMISIDIKQYFYNIDLEVVSEQLTEEIKQGNRKLNDKELVFTPLLLKIHKIYQEKLQLPSDLKTNKVIPIGLLSSGIIGNWYLKDLDKQIIENLSPAYYGRYVDDILIVISNANVPNDEQKPKSWVLNTFFENRGIFKKVELIKKTKKITSSDKKNSDKFYWTKNDKIVIQKDKTVIYAFDSKESKAVLENFKKNIRKNSSAFWYLPDDADVNNDFDESVYELTYTDSVNKIRSVQGIKQSKYGASVYLAKKIKLSLLSENTNEEETTEQILTFFKGRINLEFNSVWEKVLTYFLINKESKAFWLFVKETVVSISRLDFDEDKELLKEIKINQGCFLKNCIALALSLNPNFLSENLKVDLNELTNTWFSVDNIEELINKYRKTNLFRHSYVIQPILNYTSVNNNVSYINYNLKNYGEAAELDEKKLKFSPRFIYLHEFTHFNSLMALSNSVQEINVVNSFVNIKKLFLEEVTLYDKSKITENKVINKSFDNYHKTNYELRNPQEYPPFGNGKSDLELNNLKKSYYFNTKRENISETIIFDEIEINQYSKGKDLLRIAIANMIVKEENIKASMFDEPILSTDRRKELIDILNQAEKCNTDILVLPEVSIPHQWLPVIADEARRKQRVIIAGIEHIRINNVCFNLIATCLPVEKNGIKDVIITLRLKNHYSPHESKLIRDRGKIVPIPTPYSYNKFIWNKAHFGVYNCYELADITHRSIFRSEVDMLFASEYNRDINYFSNITESISRDVHCYFIQVNSSDMGDSRITSPSKTEVKDIIRLKGGKNSVVLYDEINLKKLREFQATKVDGQDTKIFKNTPPNYKHEKAEKRLNN